MVVVCVFVVWCCVCKGCGCGGGGGCGGGWWWSVVVNTLAWESMMGLVTGALRVLQICTIGDVKCHRSVAHVSKKQWDVFVLSEQ